jgi:hypothetical protein
MSQRAATLATEGFDDEDEDPPVTAAPVGATPTPKEKVPAARWPSTSETVRQETV